MIDGFVLVPSVSYENIYEMLDLPLYAPADKVRLKFVEAARGLMPLIEIGHEEALFDFSKLSQDYERVSTNDGKRLYDLWVALTDSNMEVVYEEGYPTEKALGQLKQIRRIRLEKLEHTHGKNLGRMLQGQKGKLVMGREGSYIELGGQNSEGN